MYKGNIATGNDDYFTQGFAINTKKLVFLSLFIKRGVKTRDPPMTFYA